MRFRSIGVSASSKEEYLEKIKEQENSYIEQSTLAHIGFISIDEKKDLSDEYDLLGPKSNYKIKNIKRIRINRRKKNRKRISSIQYFKKKIIFRHKRKRINSEVFKPKVNLFEE